MVKREHSGTRLPGFALISETLRELFHFFLPEFPHLKRRYNNCIRKFKVV